MRSCTTEEHHEPAGTPPARAVARRPIADLRPHPELLALAGDPPPEEVERLAHALRLGCRLDFLIEAAPDGRVLLGHAALLAARQAGLKDVEVVVRTDLAGRPEAVVTLAVLDAHLDNVLQRWL